MSNTTTVRDLAYAFSRLLLRATMDTEVEIKFSDTGIIYKLPDARTGEMTITHFQKTNPAKQCTPLS